MPDTAQKTDNSSTNNGQPTSPALERVKTQIASSLFISFPVLLVTILGALIFLFSVIHGQGSRNGQPDVGLSTTEKMALAASVQVAIGMVMGFVSVFMGLMITWFGIIAAFEFSGTVGDKAGATLKGASPGLLFYLGGIILIGVSLYKPITYEEPSPLKVE